MAYLTVTAYLHRTIIAYICVCLQVEMLLICNHCVSQRCAIVLTHIASFSDNNNKKHDVLLCKWQDACVVCAQMLVFIATGHSCFITFGPTCVSVCVCAIIWSFYFALFKINSLKCRTRDHLSCIVHGITVFSRVVKAWTSPCSMYIGW